MNRPTPNPSVSDELADILAANHESFIEMAQILLADPDTQNRPQLEASIARHAQGLIDLGRHRVALDLKAKGWELDDLGTWCRRYTTDEYPFPVEPYTDDGPDGGWVYAEHNQHARMIDGTAPVKWGVTYEQRFYVV